MQHITRATAEFESWLAQHTQLDGKDLDYKHRQMAARSSAFPFLRATYYRWAQLWPTVCPRLNAAPSVLAVGDLHVENFGTWRDPEGRLVWGINDFDETYPLPYTNDLVRLAVSTRFAVDAGPLSVAPVTACRQILAGYSEGLRDGLNGKARPFVLEEDHADLRKMALSQPRDPVHFWTKLSSLLARKPVNPPPEARAALEAMLPDANLTCQFRKRRKVGLGSLGKPRFVALASWCGGQVARDAKPLTMSASVWALANGGEEKKLYARIIAAAVRCPDPFLHLTENWVVRRLAPHSSRIELAVLARVKDESHLLRAMGRETANVHLGSSAAAEQILRDLADRPSGWLLKAADRMAKATLKDWGDWRKAHRERKVSAEDSAART